MLNLYYSFKKKISGEGTQSKIISGIFWSFLGTAVSRGFILISLFLVARFLSVEDYGKVSILRSFITTFTLFSLGSFGITATKYLALYANNDQKTASEIFSLTRIIVFITSLVTLIFSIIFRKYLTEKIIGDASLQNEFVVSLIAIFFAALNGLQTGALAGLESFKSSSIINIVNGFLTLPILIFGAKFYGTMGVIVGLAIVNFLIWVFSAYYLIVETKKHNIYITFKNLKKHWDTVLHFSLPSFLGSLMLSPVVLICNSIMINNLNDGYEQLAYYNAAFNYSQLGLVLVGILGQVFYPYTMKFFEKNNKKFDFIDLINPYFVSIFISLPILFFPDVFASFYGAKYENFNNYLSITFIVFSLIMNSQTLGVARYYAASNSMWIGFVGNLMWGIIAIILSKVLVNYGSYGRALAFTLSYIFNTINTLYFLPKLFNKKIFNLSVLSNFYNLGILIILILNAMFYYYISDSYLWRGFAFIISNVLILYIFYRWYLSKAK